MDCILRFCFERDVVRSGRACVWGSLFDGPSVATRVRKIEAVFNVEVDEVQRGGG